MPHRTVFQWGKNHVHPFTMFVGGFVIGVLATGTVAWAWDASDKADVEIEDVTVTRTKKTSPAPTVSPRPTASPSVSF